MSRGLRALDSASRCLYSEVMAPPLPAIVAVLLLSAGARAEVSARSGHPLVVQLKAGLARAFLGQPDRELYSVEPQRARALEAGVAARDFEALLLTVRKARVVQRGRRPDESQELFERAIAVVAQELGADAGQAQRLYGGRRLPNEGSREELAARIALLGQVRPQLGQAGQRALDRRLRGYQSALAAMTRSDAGGLGIFGLARAGLAAPNSERGFVLAAAPLAPPSALTPEELRALGAVPAAQPFALRNGAVPERGAGTEKPAPQASGVAWLYQTALAYLDDTRAADLTRALSKNIVGFIGYCYGYVKEGLIRAGFFPSSVKRPEQVGLVGIGSGSAYMFALLTPSQLEARGLRKVKASDIPWAPMNENLNGFILVWAPTCNGFHAEHGHIEVIRSRAKPEQFTPAVRRQLFGDPARGIPGRLRQDDLLVMSDGASGRRVSVLRRFSAEPQTRKTVRDLRGRSVSIPCLTVMAPIKVP